LLQHPFTTIMAINHSLPCGERLQSSTHTLFQPHHISSVKQHTRIRSFSTSDTHLVSYINTIDTLAPLDIPTPDTPTPDTPTPDTPTPDTPTPDTPTPDMASADLQNFNAARVKHGLTALDLTKIHDLLVEVAMDGGRIMVAAEHEVLVAAQCKNNTSDLVTEFDKQIEAMVETRLRKAYPTFGFLGEETFKHGTQLADTPTFVCDPIDGTLNFSKGVPNCAISLALTIEKKPVIGVVYNPFRGDLYHAIKGQGAYLKKTATGLEVKLPLRSMPPPPMPSLNACLIALEWGNQRSGQNWALRTSVHNQLLTSKEEGGAMCKSIRSNGSAALDFCYVAQGIIDVFWEGGVWVWDVCAGWIILEEAGGIVASANPGDWSPSLEGRLYFAVRHAHPKDQKAVVEELWGIMGDRKFVY
jgi:myo-inositol-1(or 4)-monophosphatase